MGAAWRGEAAMAVTRRDILMQVGLAGGVGATFAAM
jgi:hypothetical protein